MRIPSNKLQNSAPQERGATVTSGEQTRLIRGRSAEPKSQTPTSSATSPDQPNRADNVARIMETLGTTDLNFAKGIHAQLINASSTADGGYDGTSLFFSLAAMKGKQCKDQFQAMLVAQIAVTHVLAMKQASQLARADHLAILDSTERAYNKLARTFLMQFEALNRVETGGEQKVTVQNVSVSEGGQAIVGNVSQGAPEQAVKKTPALTDARQPTMPIIGTPAFDPVPVKRRKR